VIWRLAVAATVVILATACAQKPTRPEAPAAEPPRSGKGSRKPPPAMPPAAPAGGGLYAPHIRDSGPAVPPDISQIPEPLPVEEPLARYGNRSPYTVLGRNYTVMDSAEGYVERGVASWYGNKFHGRPTSSFEPYDMYKFTAAHRSLPLPSYVQVTNLENGKSVVVRVNDRGPFHDNRLIDLSYVAAVKLDMHNQGIARVEVRALPPLGSQTRLAAVQDSLGPVGAGVAPTVQVPEGRLYLQVASFGERVNADALKQRLRAAGIKDVELQRAEVEGKSLWRVRIGPYARPGNLERARGKVRALGLGEPQTVRH
jgi:rare lipoprotein A